MGNITQILFNTNHEAPNIWVIVIIGIITVAVSAFNSYYRSSTPPDTKKKNNKK